MKIAVVIPALDEARFVERAVSSALERSLDTASGPGGKATAVSSSAVAAGVGRQRVDVSARRAVAASGNDQADEVWIEGDPLEVVVVDGGSRDETIKRAEAAGARVLRGDRGRGEQQDVGWRATQADVVLFLHADTRLPVGWSQCVADVMRNPEVAGGAFRFRFDEQGVIWRLMEWGVALRVLVLGLPYGDQGLFLRRSILEGAGGVPHVALMEDLDLVRMIKRVGRLAVLREAVTTSSRRYRVGGLPRTVATHFVALFSWYLGLDRARVARWVRE